MAPVFCTNPDPEDDQSNHPDLSYRGEQRPIMHLEADLHNTVDWAEGHELRWAFTLSNASADI